MGSLSDYLPHEECYVCRQYIYNKNIECVGPFKSFIEADSYADLSRYKDKREIVMSKILFTWNFLPNFLKKLDLSTDFYPKIMLKDIKPHESHNDEE